MNRCNVGLCDIPFLFPNFGVLPTEGYQQELLTRMDAPYLVNNTLLLMPRFTPGATGLRMRRRTCTIPTLHEHQPDQRCVDQRDEGEEQPHDEGRLLH